MKRLEKMTDDELVESYSNGCNEAFNTLLNRYDHLIHTYIRCNIKDSDIVEDIFQEIFIKVLTTIKNGRYSSYGKFRQWLMRLAHNVIIDFFRKEKYSIEIPLVDKYDNDDTFLWLSSDEKTMDEIMVIADTIDDLHRKLGLLSEEQREVIKMRYWDNLSFKEIADATGVSINTALGRMRYAIINLRKP